MAQTFIWPTTTKRVTSPFGWRRHPITGEAQSKHNGIDIAKPGSRPIFAAADGVVRRSYTSTSYGETIMIEHEINGETWETVYAHMRENSRRFKDGQRVEQGDVIGQMGDTGNSTGQHLHFELHKGGLWNMAKSNAVDPEQYLEKDLYPENNLVVDGKWGNATTKALQKTLGTVQDGILSDQSRNEIAEALYGTTAEFGTGKKGSLVIKALQKLLKVKQDGLLGPVTIGALQAYLGTVKDNKLSRPSLVVKELQRRLNAGTFK
ncbi:hypothetical protein HMI01_10720 [Halolactibacillus miurensis]|uniref:Peptidase family M23 n=1 Tax=Halolactibacillus miurensis TaxID=306541 RepID=A0A1I6SIR7_9BACI|nr:M23 family metallopeptidase [Halolactibacillus miurensis]GEM04084.1 hypothetical protein HMI01_10720 [Halolactibacillus miurensis]SFS76648.1 Peptidase family M23 [Halolactibacillus miurensis]